MISRFLSVVDGVSKIAGGVAVVMLIGIAALILAEIIMRVALNLSLDFAWEYSTYFTAIVIFCGAAYTLRTGGHVRVSLFDMGPEIVGGRPREFSKPPSEVERARQQQPIGPWRSVD